MRIGTKSILDCRLAGWSSVLFTPWGLDQHHLSVGCEVRLLRHPALPLVHQLSLVSPLDLLHDVLCILISAMQIVWRETPWNTRVQLLLLFIDAGLGATLGGKLALRAGGRRQCQHRPSIISWNIFWQLTQSFNFFWIFQLFSRVGISTYSKQMTRMYVPGNLCSRGFKEFKILGMIAHFWAKGSFLNFQISEFQIAFLFY